MNPMGHNCKSPSRFMHGFLNGMSMRRKFSGFHEDCADLITRIPGLPALRVICSLLVLRNMQQTRRVTVFTVGNGDEYPVTVTGRIIGVFMTLVGAALFTTLTSCLASNFPTAARRSSVVSS